MPGHERFVANMLAGVGPVPAVLFVVAADEGWMPQSAEHLAALARSASEHVLVVIRRPTSPIPAPAIAQVRERLAGCAGRARHRSGRGARRTGGTGRRGCPRRTATPTCGCGSTARSPSAARAPSSPARSPRAPSASATNSSTPGGASPSAGLQSLGRDQTEVGAVARVAVNLRGVDRQHIGRGDALRTPARGWTRPRSTSRCEPPGKLHRELVLHIGSAAVPVHVRPLGTAARLRLARPLPLRVGDIGLLRDPGEHRIAAGIEVLDVRPPPLRRRGAARDRADGTGDRTRRTRRYARAQMSCAPWVLRRRGSGSANGSSTRSGGPSGVNK